MTPPLLSLDGSLGQSSMVLGAADDAAKYMTRVTVCFCAWLPHFDAAETGAAGGGMTHRSATSEIDLSLVQHFRIKFKFGE